MAGTSKESQGRDPYPVQVNLELIGGEVPTFIAVILDITEAVAAKRGHQELQEQLRQAQKMEAVGRLAGGVAHDFNNLLTVILGNCALLSDELPPGSPCIEDVDQISDAGQRAKSLTQQLLAFSRRQTLRPEVVDLNQLIGGLHRMLRRLIGEDIDLQTLPGAGLWSIKADAGQLNQVVMNLASTRGTPCPPGGS